KSRLTFSCLHLRGLYTDTTQRLSESRFRHLASRLWLSSLFSFSLLDPFLRLANDVYRQFTVPSGVPADTYDLIVALWLDVDGDSAITGADLPLVLYTYPAVITVQ